MQAVNLIRREAEKFSQGSHLNDTWKVSLKSNHLNPTVVPLHELLPPSVYHTWHLFNNCSCNICNCVFRYQFPYPNC